MPLASEDVLPVTTAPTLPLKEFHLFELLPEEIKLKIMKMSLPSERTVRLRFSARERSHQYDFKGDVPAILQVNQWWRMEAKKIYTMFPSSARDLPSSYFSFDRDTLYISMEDCHSNHRTFNVFARKFTYISNIRSLAGYSSFIFTENSRDRLPVPILAYFTGLRLVTLLEKYLPDDDIGWWLGWGTQIGPEPRMSKRLGALHELVKYHTNRGERHDFWFFRIKEQVERVVKDIRQKDLTWKGETWNEPVFYLGKCQDWRLHPENAKYEPQFCKPYAAKIHQTRSRSTKAKDQQTDGGHFE